MRGTSANRLLELPDAADKPVLTFLLLSDRFLGMWSVGGREPDFLLDSTPRHSDQRAFQREIMYKGVRVSEQGIGGGA